MKSLRLLKFRRWQSLRLMLKIQQANKFVVKRERERERENCMCKGHLSQRVDMCVCERERVRERERERGKFLLWVKYTWGNPFFERVSSNCAQVKCGRSFFGLFAKGQWSGWHLPLDTNAKECVTIDAKECVTFDAEECVRPAMSDVLF